MRFFYTAYVDCDTQEQADQVMAERFLNTHEDYGFDYTVNYKRAPEQNLVAKGELYEYRGADAVALEVRHIEVMRVAKDGAWADIHVTQPATGLTWAKRQPLTNGYFAFQVQPIGTVTQTTLTTEEALAR